MLRGRLSCVTKSSTVERGEKNGGYRCFGSGESLRRRRGRDGAGCNGELSAPGNSGTVVPWHAALSPTVYSGLAKTQVADWRNVVSGPMQMVSGPEGRQRLHYKAPQSDLLAAEVERFLAWLNADSGEPLNQGRHGVSLVCYAPSPSAMATGGCPGYR